MAGKVHVFGIRHHGPGSARSLLVKAWENIASSVFLLHVRSARWGSISDANTQPFSRTWGRRDWMMAHAGSLDQKLPDVAGPFEPVGSTDTEQLFCQLLNRCVERKWRSRGTVFGGDGPTDAGWVIHERVTFA